MGTVPREQEEEGPVEDFIRNICERVKDDMPDSLKDDEWNITINRKGCKLCGSTGMCLDNENDIKPCSFENCKHRSKETMWKVEAEACQKDAQGLLKMIPNVKHSPIKETTDACSTPGSLETKVVVGCDECSRNCRETLEPGEKIIMWCSHHGEYGKGEWKLL